MVDTIVIRVLNFSKYRKLYEQYYNPQKVKGVVTTAYVQQDSGEIIERDFAMSTVYHDRDRFIPVTFRGSNNISSSHYTLSYSFNTSLDYLEFNFAIPKYLYGTNLLQFVSIYDQECSMHFCRLMIFINKFMQENFIELPCLEDVEINRIDLCYNQFFNSKQDALHYLDEQKKLLIKYARSSKNNYRSYDTSLMYITGRYSFKIYHKGTEFEKKDLRELEKHGNKMNYPLGDFLNHANNILRYEMTFRRSYLNYIMKFYFFSSLVKGSSPLYKGHKLAVFGREIALYFEGDKGFRGQYKTAVELWLGKAKKFTLKSVFDFSDDLRLQFDSDCVSFDGTFFLILFNTFWKKVRDYQLHSLISINDLSERIKKFNDAVKLKNEVCNQKKHGKDEFRLLSVGMLVQYMPLTEIKKYMPERSYFRLCADLKSIGIDGASTVLNCPVPKLDYLDYRMYFSSYHVEI